MMLTCQLQYYDQSLWNPEADPQDLDHIETSRI